MFVSVEVCLMVVVTIVVDDPVPNVYVKVVSPVPEGNGPAEPEVPVVRGIVGTTLPPLLGGTEGEGTIDV